MGRSVRKLAFSTVLVACLGADATAEVLGPLLPARTLEVGIMERKINRVMERDEDDTYLLKTFDYPVTVRYGITSSATISFEVSGYPNSWVHEGAVVHYTVGAGITALVWSRDDLAIATGAHYYRQLAVWSAPGACDNVVQGIDWTLVGQQSLRLGKSEGVVWGGPTVSYVIRVPQAPCIEESATPKQVIGGVVGLTLFSRIGPFLQGSYGWIGESEYRLSLGYRF